MQTRITSLRHARTAIRILAACVVAAMMLPTIGARTSPRIAGRAESEHQVSECEIAYRSATAGDERARTAHYRTASCCVIIGASMANVAICRNDYRRHHPQRTSPMERAKYRRLLSTTHTASTTDGNALRRDSTVSPHCCLIPPCVIPPWPRPSRCLCNCLLRKNAWRHYVER